MEIENLNLYRDSAWNDLKIRFCGHSECLPLHSYGPGSRPYYLLHFVLSGKGKLLVNKTEYQIEAGQLFLVEPDQMVFYQADEDTPWTYSWVGFNGGLASHFINRLGLGYPTLTRDIEPDTFIEIKKLLENIIKSNINNTVNDLYINGQFLILLSKIGTDEFGKEMIIDEEKYSAEKYVQEAIMIVEDFYGTELTVNDIANRLNINRSYLSSIFVKHVGTPLKKYLVEFRISQSEEFLFTTNWSVDYISKVCGFNNPSYFSKIFKKFHGLSPTEYREQRHLRRSQTVFID
ncbi:AraC family transcriptional regulator [Enterococcus faecium]|uniref:AraC family transcriptional regulator n=1 Tax=Enterococcus faecium TaxID=1352 RepID=UPI000A184286|nr:AraC family transcriptional regulator [Enterococcus faecium]MCF8614376.1 AraC family transcriptional regulator [Enterococcus faecium]MCF8652640.1 AraC family transcriptional regulator [Enterococcus faecium]MCF8667184.1 AraC family transcriptional regulator [Enterococcus faecium]MDV4725287.1 AraC family transcriptional regulator [Enterococcus faecium]MDV4888093.1 AraC family transcriptional regulator [Enterococcus faecium]